MNKSDYILAPLTWVWLTIARTVLCILGLFTVALGLCFARDVKNTKIEMIYAPGFSWHLRKLPSWNWIWIWDNDRDGSLGDRRGRWFNKRKGTPHTFISQWIWMAIRNPVNNMRFSDRFTCDAVMCDHYVVESENWYFVKSVHRLSGKRFYAFRYERLREDGTVLDIRLGYKVWKTIVDKVKEKDWQYFNHEGRRYRGFALRFFPYRKQ